MAERTQIEWCDSTFNPWTGCTKVGPGCDHCYAESWSKRAGDKVGKWGPGAPRVRTSPAMWRQPVRWNALPFVQCGGCGWRGADPHEGTPGWLECPACGKESLAPARRRVFCASLADVFDNEVPTLWRQQLMTLVADTPNLDWLFLTKRIGNARKMLADASTHDGRLLTANDEYRPPANLWIGATIVNQEEADRDIPKLLATPAAVRFLSMEPLLGPVALETIYNTDFGEGQPYLHPLIGRVSDGHGDGCNAPSIDWVITGGESGHGARPMHPDWLCSLRRQCEAAGVPFLFKQWGEWAVAKDHPDTLLPVNRWAWANEHGHPADTGFGPFKRELDHHQLMARIGKKAAGRLLDGVEHNGFPRGAA